MGLKEGLSFIRACSPWLLIGRASLPDSLRSSVHFVLAIFFLYLCCLSIFGKKARGGETTKEAQIHMSFNAM